MHIFVLLLLVLILIWIVYALSKPSFEVNYGGNSSCNSDYDCVPPQVCGFNNTCINNTDASLIAAAQTSINVLINNLNILSAGVDSNSAFQSVLVAHKATSIINDANKLVMGIATVKGKLITPGCQFQTLGNCNYASAVNLLTPSTSPSIINQVSEKAKLLQYYPSYVTQAISALITDINGYIGNLTAQSDIDTFNATLSLLGSASVVSQTMQAYRDAVNLYSGI